MNDKEESKLKRLEEEVDKLEPCPIQSLNLTDREYKERCKGYYIAIAEVKYAMKRLSEEGGKTNE